MKPMRSRRRRRRRSASIRHTDTIFEAGQTAASNYLLNPLGWPAQDLQDSGLLTDFCDRKPHRASQNKRSEDFMGKSEVARFSLRAGLLERAPLKGSLRWRRCDHRLFPPE